MCIINRIIYPVAVHSSILKFAILKSYKCIIHFLSSDAYVRIALQQPGRPESKIQTKVRKKTQNPIYNEEHLMTISPRIEDLNYASLTFTVYNRETIRSDEAIGQVRLGFGATEESEFTHWNNVLQNPGRDYTSWHTLMEPNADS